MSEIAERINFNARRSSEFIDGVVLSDASIDQIIQAEAGYEEEIERLELRVTELEKSQFVWHKYPEEKPEPMAYHTPTKGVSWRNVLVANKDAIDIGVIRFIGLEVDMIFPKRTTHWAYLPEPPRQA